MPVRPEPNGSPCSSSYKIGQIARERKKGIDIRTQVAYYYGMTQATKDALADAETLRLNARNEGYGPTVFRGVRAAGEEGDWTAVWIDDRPDAAATCARLAARAAFRAVPGLRC